ncbi:MAG: cytochrome c family protein [Planctomycetota bacterium]|nr:cytochrome c family protein [Planctomycetota bacterium]
MSYLFIGRTVLPFSSPYDYSLDEKSISAAPWYAGLASSVFDAMGTVFYLPDDEERTSLQSTGCNSLLRYMPTSPTVKWGNLTIEVQSDTLLVLDWKQQFTLPLRRNRGRDVGVLVIWEKGSRDKIVFEQKLAAAALTSASNSSAARRLESILDEFAGPVATYWRRDVTASLTADARLDAAADRIGLVASHGPLGADKYFSIDGSKRVKETHTERCGTCHPKAVESWLASRHSNSMGTLISRTRERDPRCLPCHAREHTVGADGGMAVAGHDAVTCMSCHSKPDPLNACSDCHTTITDPKQVYKLHRDSICSGKRDSLRPGKCVRE